MAQGLAPCGSGDDIDTRKQRIERWNIGIPRDVEAFMKSGPFQKRLKNKDQIVNAWTEIRAGL